MHTPRRIPSRLYIMLLLGVSGAATADLIANPGTIAGGQSLTVNPQDTLLVGSTDLSVDGNLVNQGQINALDSAMYGSNIYVGGILSNSGNIFANGALSILGGPGANTHRIINQAGGNISLSGYVDMYSNDAYFENAGRLSVIPGLGHNVGYHYGFTAGVIRGTALVHK